MAKIFTLKADNFARLVSVELDVKDQSVVVLKGKNTHGKSSIINAIWAACQWRDAKKHIKKPVHDDAEQATIVVDFGELKVQRIINPDGSDKLKVWDANGRGVTPPQGVLDKFIGDLTFDPEAFGRETPQKRREIALNLVKGTLEVDPDKIDASVAEIYEERRDLNRTIKSYSGELENIPEVPEGTPEEIQSIDALTEELKEGYSLKETNDRHRKELANIHAEGIRLKQEIEEIKSKLDQKHKQLDLVRVDYEAQKQIVAGLQDPDLDSMAEKISNLEEVNSHVRNRMKKADVQGRIDTLQKKADEMTEEMNKLKASKDEALQKADFPIQGLSVSEDDVLYKGIPFEQCSQAEQEEISFSIGAALNPQARIMFFKNASLMDSDTLSRMEQKADEMDYQIFLERVGTIDDGQTGFYIEDGSVVIPETAEN